MKKVVFEIPGKPAHKGRVRTRVVGKGKGWCGKAFAMHYKDSKTMKSEEKIRWCWLSQTDGAGPFEGPVELKVVAIFEPPKSCSKKRRLELLGEPHTKKPDASNIAKQVEDALNTLAYKDDNQIAQLHVQKMYGEDAKTIVEITEL